MNDILFSPDDLIIRDGDLAVGDATEVHQADIIIAEKAWYVFAPTLGVGLRNYLLDDAVAPGLSASIRNELARDGCVVQSLAIDEQGNVNVSGNY